MHFIGKQIPIADSSQFLPLTGCFLEQIASVVLAAAFEGFDGFTYDGKVVAGSLTHTQDGARARCDFQLSVQAGAAGVSALCKYTRPDVYYSQVWPRIAHCLRAARFLGGKATTAAQTDESEPEPESNESEPESDETDLETLARFQAAGRALAAPEAATGAHLAAVEALRECLARPDDARRYGATAVLYLRELCGHRDGAVRRAALDVLWGL